MDALIELARKRFKALSEILQRADDVRDEWLELRAFLQNAEHVQRRLDPSAPPVAFLPAVAYEAPPAPKTVIMKRMENSGEIAAHVFRKHGPKLHVNEVLQLMSANGWMGSGDAHKDYKNIHRQLSSNRTRFRSLGKGMFERVEEPKPRTPRRKA